MYLKLFSKIFSMIIVLIFQVSFISSLPAGISNVNFVLVLLILILGFSSYKEAMLWSMSLGLLLDMFNFVFFGITTLSLFVTVYFTNFLLENVLTNRSLYTFIALTLFASVFYEISIVFLNIFYSFVIGMDIPYHFSRAFWQDELIKIFANLILVFVLFYTFSFFSKRFKPMFLIR